MAVSLNIPQKEIKHTFAKRLCLWEGTALFFMSGGRKRGEIRGRLGRAVFKSV